jgi:hypothetical protein
MANSSKGTGANTLTGELQDVWCVASKVQVLELPAADSHVHAAHATTPVAHAGNTRHVWKELHQLQARELVAWSLLHHT